MRPRLHSSLEIAGTPQFILVVMVADESVSLVSKESLTVQESQALVRSCDEGESERTHSLHNQGQLSRAKVLHGWGWEVLDVLA